MCSYQNPRGLPRSVHDPRPSGREPIQGDADRSGITGKNHLRRMAGVVIDRVVGRDHAPVVAERVAGVGIDVEPRVIAARDVDPDAVALLEDVRGRIERDRDRDDVARVQRSGLVVEPFAVTGAQDRVAEIQVEARADNRGWAGSRRSAWR